MNTFNVNSIPTLVIINERGETVTDWGRSAVQKNPEECIAEWRQGQPGVSWLQLLKIWK